MSQTRHERLRNLFLAACELEDKERAAFVALACGDDASLRGELETLLEEDRRFDEVPSAAESGFAVGALEKLQQTGHGDPDRLRVGLHDDAESGPKTPRDPSPAARTIGLSHYSRRGEIARGGMGEILKAWDEDINRPVAMKMMLGKTDAPVDPEKLMRFLEEAQITGQLDHPGVVPVYQLGLDREQRLFFTMRLVKGRSLHEIFELVRKQEDGWTRTRVLGVVIKVCETLAYAHSKRVIHRDIKPRNIMVGHFGETYVMDWGLAKVMGRKDLHDLRFRDLDSPTRTSIRTHRSDEDGTDLDSPLITMDGTVVGTPSYMPPEQAAGLIDELDQRSDVYAVGAMLYELLTGQMPYVKPGVRISTRTILTAVVDGPPKPIHQIDSSVPQELAAICEKAMARDKKERYNSSLEMGEDLQAYLDHRVVQAYKTGAVAEFKSWVVRNRNTAAVAAAAAVLLLAGLIWFLISQEQKNEEITLANEALEVKNKELAAQKDLAQSRLAEVLRLSDVKRLRDYEEEAEKLWPCLPGKVPEMESWLKRAGKLAKNLERHQQNLAALRERALDHEEISKTQNRERHPDVEKLEALRATRRKLENEIERLSATVKPGGKATLLSYGDDPKNKPLTVYFRQSFAVDEVAKPETLAKPEAEALVLELGMDDGVVVYLNGTEVLRVNMPEGRVESKTTASKGTVAPVHLREEISAESLLPGSNVLAIEVHQVGPSSSDIFLSAELSAGKRILVSKSSLWRYDDSGREPTGDWKSREFDDATWSTGKAPLGYGFREGPGRILEFSKALSELNDHIAALEREISRPRTWEFQNAEDEWQHDTLEELVGELERFTDSDPNKGTVASVQERLKFARTIRKRSIEDHQEAWDEASRSIAELPRYNGLHVKPQIGLVPVGPDRDSKLWEFAHLQTGDPPERGADGKLVITETSALVLVLIPGGRFRMGAIRPTEETPEGLPNVDPYAHADEGPLCEIQLDPFFLSKYEMTQEQWSRFTGENPSANRVGEETIGELHPVEQVSWERCEEVLRQLGLVLPTEAQWEYAARAGTTTIWWRGDKRDGLRGYVNLADQAAARAGARWSDIVDWPELDDGYALHAPVVSFGANPFGLHNVHGNVWEWCLDWYGLYSFPVRASDGKRYVSPTAASHGHAIRGGSFIYGARGARSAIRRQGPPDFRSHDLGVRPARVLATD